MFIRLTLVCFCSILASCSLLLMPEADTALGDLKAGNYQLDPTHTTVLFKVEHLGISTFVGRFNAVDASLDYDPENPAKSRLDARVQLASIDINQPELAETLRGCNWFCVEKYPTAQFTTTRDATVDGSRLTFPGELRFRGQTQPVQVIVTVKGGANNRLTGYYTLGFRADMTFLRSDFGMDRFIPLVGDEVVVEVYTEFQRR